MEQPSSLGFVWVVAVVLTILTFGYNPYGECIKYQKVAASDLPPAVQAKLDDTGRGYSMHDSLVAAGAQILVQQQDYDGGPRKKIVLNGHTREFKYIASVMDLRPKSFDVLTGPRLQDDTGTLPQALGWPISRFLTLSRQDLSIEREVSICGRMYGVVRQGEYVYVVTYNDADEIEYGRVRLPES